MNEGLPGDGMFPRIDAMFAPLPDKPDHDALEREILDLWERERTFEQLRELNADGPTFSFFDGPVTANKSLARAHGVGPDAEGRLPALQGVARLSPALSERLRLPGSLDRGRRRARARAQLEARDRGVRARRVRAALPRGRRPVVTGADARVDPARPVDGLGQRLLHVLRHEHRVHLALPRRSCTRRAGCTWATARRSGARAAAPRSRRTSCRALRGQGRPVALRPLPAARPRGRVDRVWTTTPWTLPANVAAAVNPEARVRAARERRLGRRARCSRTRLRAQLREPSSSAALRRPVRRRSRPAPGRAPGDPVGRGRARHGHRHRPHRAGLRRRGLRALARCTACRCSRPVDEGGRFYPEYGWLHGALDGEAAEQIVGDLARPWPARRGRDARAQLPVLLALPHAADLPARRRLVHLGRRDPRSRCSTRTRRSSGRPRTWASAWTTGCATWATGTSPAAATTGCRCRSTRAPAGT